MRSARVLLSAVALGAVALLGGTACAAASANAAGVWVQVNPGTIQPGSTVTVRASCGDDTNPATISSRAFGSATVQPRDGVLSTEVRVPADTAANTYDVDLTCRTGSKATTTLTVLGGREAAPAARTTIGPHTGGGFLATGGDGLSSGPFIWMAAGIASLIGAVVVSIRTKRRQRVPVRSRR